MMKVGRGPLVWTTALLAGWLILSGCGQGPAASASLQPAKPGSASASGSSDWETVVAAGKREGKVAIIGPVGDAVSNILVDPFQKQYGITVDFIALPGNAATARINQERSASQYNLDILIAGSAGSLDSLIPNKALDSIDSALILPEVKDPKNWRGGALPVLGPNHEILSMTPYQRGTLFYNKNLVKAEEIKSYKDLLDPKWKDKLQSDDPRRPGPGQATFTFFYLHPDLGGDFIRALAKQNITMQNDYQQEIDIVGQGRAPLMIGGVDRLAEARIKQGAPIGIVEPGKIKEGTDVSAAAGNVSVFNKAPHPNAAKVYVNWLLTKATQEAYARTNDLVSSRADVNGDWTEPWRLPAPGAIQTDGEAAQAVIRDKLVPLLKEAFPT
jgi:iron(III) transport system substrate-binding protein